MKREALIGLATATLMLPGCASIISGSSDEIGVATNPPGADCILYREGANIGRINPTPGKLVVSRSYNDITAKCNKEGYDEGAGTAGSGFNGWVLGNLVFGGLVGVVIDTATANATGYDSELLVTLLPAPQAEEPIAQDAPMARKEDQTL
jgi:hypothetical protein